MPKIVRIQLGMLVRMEKVVTVEVPDDFDSLDESVRKEIMSSVYDADEGDGFSDDDWCEEATHYFIGYENSLLTSKPMYRVVRFSDDPNTFIVEPEGGI